MIYSEGNFIWRLLNTPFYGTNSSHIVLNISQYNEDLAGNYTAVVSAFCYDVTWSGVTCNSQYWDLTCKLSSYTVTNNLLTISLSTLGKLCSCMHACMQAPVISCIITASTNVI